MSYLWMLITNYFGTIALLFLPFWLYCFIKENVRLVLHSMGFRVFTIRELKKRNMIVDVVDNVVVAEATTAKTFEAEVVKHKDVVEVWGNVAKQLEDFNSTCHSYQAPKRKRKH